jgi:hypothetical protein
MTAGWDSLPMGLMRSDSPVAVRWSRIRTLAPWLMKLVANTSEAHTELITSARWVIVPFQLEHRRRFLQRRIHWIPLTALWREGHSQALLAHSLPAWEALLKATDTQLSKQDSGHIMVFTRFAAHQGGWDAFCGTGLGSASAGFG